VITQLLRRLQQLAEGLADGRFIREIFLQRLPPNVRMVLASSSEDTAIDDLAQLADRVMEVSIPASVNNLSQPTPSAEMDQLRAELASLTESVNNLRKNYRRSFNPRQQSPSPARRFHSSKDQLLVQELCWYHQTFGDLTRKCKPPCSRLGNGLADR